VVCYRNVVGHFSTSAVAIVTSPVDALEAVAADIRALTARKPGSKLAKKLDDRVRKVNVAIAKLAVPDRHCALGELKGAVAGIDTKVKDLVLPAAVGVALMDRRATLHAWALNFCSDIITARIRACGSGRQAPLRGASVSSTIAAKPSISAFGFASCFGYGRCHDVRFTFACVLCASVSVFISAPHSRFPAGVRGARGPRLSPRGRRAGAR
jgi:hypothetical protein